MPSSIYAPFKECVISHTVLSSLLERWHTCRVKSVLLHMDKVSYKEERQWWQLKSHSMFTWVSSLLKWFSYWFCCCCCFLTIKPPVSYCKKENTRREMILYPAVTLLKKKKKLFCFNQNAWQCGFMTTLWRREIKICTSGATESEESSSPLQTSHMA